MLRSVIGLLLALLAVSGAANALERRVALVIGNSSYKYAGRLPNPANDATDMAHALQRLGFQVTLDRDLDWERLAREVDTYLTHARGADVAIFFYAGHGLQHDGGAFILPTDARLENEFALKRETFSVQDIVTQLGNTTRASIVLLDACRNNPLAEKLRSAAFTGNRALNIGRGLGRIDVGGNSLVVYSAAPGQEARDGVGRNSPFTEALLRHIDTPGLEVEQMLKRVTAEVAMATGGRQQPERLSQLKIEVTLRPLPGEIKTEPALAARPWATEGKSDEGKRREMLDMLHEKLGQPDALKLEEEQRKEDERRKEAGLRKAREEADALREERIRREEEQRAKREAKLKEKEELLRRRLEEIEQNQKQIAKKSEELDKTNEEINKTKLEIEKNKTESLKSKTEDGQEKSDTYKPEKLTQDTTGSTAEEESQEQPRHRRKSRSSSRRQYGGSSRRHYYRGGGGGGHMAPPAP